MKKRFGFVCLMIGLLAACSSEPAKPATFDDICQKAGSRVVIEGYLQLPSMGPNCKSGRCMLNLISALQGRIQSITALVRNTADRNSGVNAIEPLPDNFRPEDLRIHADDGSIVPVNTKVKVVGDVQKVGDSCQLSVDTIETH